MIHYSFIGYMLAIAIIMMLSVLAYRILLENKARPAANRLILLSIYAVTFIVPLLSAIFPQSPHISGIEIGQPEFGGFIGEVGMQNNEITFILPDFLLLAAWIYFFGLFITFLFTILTVFHLVSLLKRSDKMVIANMEVYVHGNKKLSSFSWGNKIFIYKKSLNSEFKNLKMLVSHEKAHLEMGHWIDLAIAQIVIIFQWFNPAAWYMRKELQRIHEYEADETVLQAGIDEKEYQMLLIQNISGSRYSGLTDGLNNCSLKKRIIMMKKTKFKKDWVTRGIAVCGFAILGGFIIHIPVVANVLETHPESEPTKQLTVLSTSSVPKSEDKNIVVANKDALKGMTIIIDGRESSYEGMTKLDPGSIDNMTILKDSKIIINLKNQEKKNLAVNNAVKAVGYETINADKSQKTAHHSDNPTQIVDQPEILAEYEGGQSQLLQDLTTSIKYPQEAYDKGIQGRVVVRFTINTNGTISDCEVAYSQNPIFDEAALKAVENLPGKWKPAEMNGKPVASVFNMPVNFKLQAK